MLMCFAMCVLFRLGLHLLQFLLLLGSQYSIYFGFKRFVNIMDLSPFLLLGQRCVIAHTLYLLCFVAQNRLEFLFLTFG